MKLAPDDHRIEPTRISSTLRNARAFATVPPTESRLYNRSCRVNFFAEEDNYSQNYRRAKNSRVFTSSIAYRRVSTKIFPRENTFNFNDFTARRGAAMSNFASRRRIFDARETRFVTGA